MNITPTRGVPLTATHPDLAAQWHPTKNGALTPADVSHGSHKRIWWQCPNGHEWEAAVFTRSLGTGCPACRKEGLAAKPASLASTDPDLAAQWHPTRNKDLTPNDVTRRDCEKAWWLCAKGHEWEASPYSRQHGSGCPYCLGKKPIPGENDLATTDPDLAAQWHPTKNGALTPADVSHGSGKKAWWLCPEGHEWETIILSRHHGSGCPYCAGKRVLIGKNDLATVRPDLAAQWHPTFNAPLEPQDTTCYANKQIWWLCPKGHAWEASLSNRMRGSGCPFCANRAVAPGFNDLATVRPDLAAQWHPTKNGNLGPQDVLPHSAKKVWWLCPKGHEWQTRVHSRSSGTGCPVCFTSTGRRLPPIHAPSRSKNVPTNKEAERT